MSEHSFSSRLRQLSRDYYQQHIGFDDYRARRKIILQQIDEEFNGRRREAAEPTMEQEESSFFLKTIAFFKNADVVEKDKSD